MKRVRINDRSLIGIWVIAGLSVLHIAKTPVPTAAFTGVDLNSEIRTLDSFVTDLGKLDKRRVELAKNGSLTSAEFTSLQNSAEDLKRRLSAVQNSLREITRKLKAAAQWEDLDATVLAKIGDSKLQSLIRRLGFKQVLENAASRFSSEGDEISSPVDDLRERVKKAQVQPSIFEPRNSAFTLRNARVAYDPAPALTETSLRCRVSLLRFGLSRAFSSSGHASQNSIDATNCFCFDSPNACLAL